LTGTYAGSNTRRMAGAAREGAGAARGTPTREAVLEAALDVFCRNTFNGTPIALIAERAGVAAGTIYRHFPSKEALGNAVYQRWKTRVVEYLEAGADPDESVRETFTRIWRQSLAFARDHPQALAFLEHQQHLNYLDEESHAVTGRSEALVVELIVRGQATGEVRDGDPAVLLALAYGAFVGLSKAVRDGVRIDAAGLARAEEAVWDLLRTPS
jgi:TetR/AcrR family transcriptional regulator, repressor of fatR-cypB operon